MLLLITLAETGGAQRYVADLVRQLTGAFEVTVAAYGHGPMADAVRQAGADYVALRHVRRPIRPARDLLGLLELVRLCRRVRPQIVHANSSKAGILGRLAALVCGVPVRIFTVHGWAFTAHDGIRARLFRAFDRLAGAGTSMTICVSGHGRTSGVKAGTCRSDRCVVIHNAVEPRPAAAPQRAGTPLILSVGRMQAPKDPLTLVRALSQLPSGGFRAAIAGAGPQLPRLTAEAERLGLDGALELLGEREDVPRLMDEADVFVLSSRSEGLPYCVLEAMAAGLPVVASAVGGVPELVEDEVTGLLVAPGDAAALARALERLLGDSELRRSMGEAGRRLVAERFDPASFGRAHVDLYRELLAGRSLAAA